MKIPYKEERFDNATGSMRMTDIDIVSELRQDAESALSFVTQCDSTVIMSDPELSRKVAGIAHYTVSGEFSSGAAYGSVEFGWTDNPATGFRDVHTARVQFGDFGWCEIDYRSQDFFVESLTNEYKMFIDAARRVPLHYPEMSGLIKKIRECDMPEDTAQKISPLLDRLDELLGNLPRKR